MCRALFLLLLSGARCLTIGGHSAGKVGIAAEDGVIGFLIDASHILHVASVDALPWGHWSVTMCSSLTSTGPV